MRRSILEKKFFFQCIGLHCLIEAYFRPEKYWLKCARLLANHLFNLNLIFLSSGLTAVAEGVAGIADVYHL